LRFPSLISLKGGLLYKPEAGSQKNNLSLAIFKFAAYTRKRLFRYSRLCGMASDAVDAVKLEIPQGFKLLKFEMSKYLKNFVKITISKI
jgi:hypothetical protein